MKIISTGILFPFKITSHSEIVKYEIHVYCSRTWPIYIIWMRFFFLIVVSLMPPELLQSLSWELLYGGDKIKVLWEQEVSFGIHKFVGLSDRYFSHSGYVSNLYNIKMTGVVNINVQCEFFHIITVPLCQLNYWIFK